MKLNVTIRPEQPSDIEAITEVTRSAFENHLVSRQTEEFIIHALRKAGVLSLSLVAELDGQVVGHIAFSPVTITDGTKDWYGMGPVSVLPKYQRQGIGTALINEGLSRLKKLGMLGCALVGDPEYYKRFGFKNDPELIHEGIPQQYFVVLPYEGSKPRGTVKFHDGFHATGVDCPKGSEESYKSSLGKWVGITLFTALCLFGSAGTLQWWNAWVFIIVNTATAVEMTSTVFKASPDLAQERKTAWRNTKKWDKVLVPFVVGVFPLASQVLAGFDKRYGWTNCIVFGESLAAIILMLAANSMAFWSMKSNRFFSSHFRIQTDRGHTVINHGPYSFIRHPGYAGMILNGLAVPVLLGSAVALWIGIANTALLVLRTALEDRALQAELPGYREYVEKVRYRLLPFVW